MTTTSRQRVIDSLSHRAPDRVPVDFGATLTSGMHCSVVAALREHYGLERGPVRVHEPYQMLGLIEDDLARAMRIDTVAVPPAETIFGFPNENWKTWRAPWGQEVLVSQHFNVRTDADGDVYIFPQGDTTAPPSGHMPRSGYFFDTIVRQQPIDEDKLNPQDNLEEFGPISEAAVAHYRREIAAALPTGRAVVATLPGLGLGDIALVPAPFLKHPRGIRDIEEWYITVSARQDYVHAIFEKQVTVGLDNLRRLHAEVGNAIDVAFICGTDFGTQTSSFCSVETFRDLYKPYYQRINGWIHSHTTWKTFKHSCGAVEKFIPDFIDCGFDILNPVQCSATGMDPGKLKETYCDKLTFWGGGIDTQHVLPFGTPQEVRQQARQRCEIFGKSGGFVFNAIHNVQARTPVANVVAMLDAVSDFNGQ